MKIVGTGRGGWDVPESSYAWQWEQQRDGRGHARCSTTAGTSSRSRTGCSARSARIFAWIGATQVAPDLAPEIVIDAPSTLVWEHDERRARRARHHCWHPTRTSGPTTTRCDERVEVTGARGYVRCNRISASRRAGAVGRRLHAKGEMRGYHALADDPPDAFAASAAHGVDYFRSREGSARDGR